MKTKRRKAGAGIDGAAVLSETNEVPSNESDSSVEKQDRLSFYLSPDGIPAWDRISPQTKEKLTSILQNKLVHKELGFSVEEVKQAEAALTIGDEEANALLDLLSSIDSMAASMIYKIPSEITSQAFAFTPEHRKKINPPLTRVLNKWAPAMLKTWKDEIGVAIVLSAVLNSQVRLMHALEEKRKKNLPQSLQRPLAPVAEMPQPAKPETKIDKPADPIESIGINA